MNFHISATDTRGITKGRRKRNKIIFFSLPLKYSCTKKANANPINMEKERVAVE